MIIYKTTNLLNGKIYVGKDSFNDPDYFGSGLILSRAIKKYGITNFKKDILEHCNTPKELDEREQHWIKILNSTDRRCGYNIAKGGTGGDTYSNQTEKRKLDIIAKRDSSRPLWDTPEYRNKIAAASTKLWKNPSHKNHMRKIMEGREIKWADKISKSITEWHKTNPISDASRQHAAEITRQKMTGKEFKKLPDDVIRKIICLYQTYGPKLIPTKLAEEGIEVSRYLVVRVLKKANVYQKWKKGIGEKSKRHASLSRCGEKNPMYKHSS